jgi:hypothetical protein
VVVPLYFYVSSSLTNPRVTGFESNIDDKHRARYICFRDVKPRQTANAAAAGPRG